MGNPKGFINVNRKTGDYRPVYERVKDYSHVNVLRENAVSEEQASRCMDCGVPFCHWACPVGNYIPDWNDYMFNGHWDKAFDLLNGTNNLPEITGRICPAICEHGCVLGINDDPVTIRENELSIIEDAFEVGRIKANIPKIRTGKKVAIIGSGPAGLSCGMQLNKAGHEVTIYEKDEKPGGLLRYGIPDFKLEKWIIDRRINIMKEEGIKFCTSTNVGVDESVDDIINENDAVCLSGGSRTPRDLNIEGRSLEGIHFAMDYLIGVNKKVSGEISSEEKILNAGCKKVLVIGGGDTGSDCIGTAHRQGATSVTQVEVLPKPPECRSEVHPWPIYPVVLKTSSSHSEGGERHWSILTKRFVGENGKVKGAQCVRVEFEETDGKSCPIMKEIPGSEFIIETDFVVLAIGFVHPEHKGMLESLGLNLDRRGNVETDAEYKTSLDKVFSAGDMNRGQSLVVWAISEGRQAAHNIDKMLMGKSSLPKM